MVLLGFTIQLMMIFKNVEVVNSSTSVFLTKFISDQMDLLVKIHLRSLEPTSVNSVCFASDYVILVDSYLCLQTEHETFVYWT